MTVSLVTGGCGFLGSHVCSHLLKMGHQVVALDDLSGETNNLQYGAEIIPESITNEGRIRYIFNHQHFDYVFHLAAYASEGLSHHIRTHLYTNNIVGSANLINAAVNAGTVKRFVFTSSVAVYGHRAYRATERDQLEPIDPYGVGKLATELDLKTAHEYYGLSYTIFRPHNIYGPRQNMNDPYRNVVAIFIRQALAGEPFTIFGDGLQTRSFTYVDEVASAIARCVEMPDTENETYNIGSSEPITIIELAQEVARACGVECHYRCLPERKEAADASPSHNKAVRTFGGMTVPLSKGLANMVAWARQQPKGEMMTGPRIEVAKNLPSAWKDRANASN
jgi:UDP-glucose 4-epimerase